MVCIFVYTGTHLCTCAYLYAHAHCGIYICVWCVCAAWCTECVHPLQMNPLQDSPNSFGMFSWALLYRHSSQTWIFCGQTWIAESSWPFDICWAPLILSRRWPEQGRALSLRSECETVPGSSLALLGKPPLCHLKFGGISQGVVRWNHFCAGRCLWWEKSMTHLERTHCELRALRPKTGLWAGSCGQGCEKEQSLDGGLDPGQLCVSRSLDSALGSFGRSWCVSLFISGGAHGVRVTLPQILVAALNVCTF